MSQPKLADVERGRTLWKRIDGVLRSAERVITKRPLLLSAATTLALFALFWWRLTPAFNTNDDVHLMWITDGTFFDEPEPHLLISPALTGRMLVFFYDNWPSVGWYSLWLYALHLIAFTVFLYVVLSDRRFRLVIHGPAVIGFFTLFYLWAWMNLQFTSVSILLGAGAVMLYATKAHLAATRTWVLVAAGLMLGYVGLIRIEALQGVVGLALPIGVFTFTRIPWRRQAVFAAATIAVALLAVTSEYLSYAGNTEWQEYRGFNQTRGDLHATPRLSGISGNREILDAAGWSTNDLTMFRSWFFMDEEVYSTEAVEAVREKTRWDRSDISDGLAEVGRDEWHRERAVFLAGLFIFGLAVGPWRKRVLMVVTTLWTLGIAVYLVAFLRLPERVAAPMLAFLGLVYLLLPVDSPRVQSWRFWTRDFWRKPDHDTGGDDGSSKGEHNSGGTSDSGGASFSRMNLVGRGEGLRSRAHLVLRGGGIAAVIIATILTVPTALRWTRTASTDNQVEQRSFAQLIDDLGNIDPDGVFVTLGPALGSQRVPPKDSAMDIPIEMIHLGWQARSPMHFANMERNGIDDLYLALALREDVYFVTRTNAIIDSVFGTYMREHYGYIGRIRPVAQVGAGNEVTVWDVFVDYKYRGDGMALVETRPDGSKTGCRIRDDAGVGALENIPDFVNGGQLRGWAVDPETGEPADLIVAMADGSLSRLGVPQQRREAEATANGAARDERIGFSIPYRGTKQSPAEVRVFAIFGDAALELFLPEGTT